ncbi:MAG: flagellar motor switch protein FliM [bacterium]
MSDILSSDEIQALSEAVFDGKVDLEGQPIPPTNQIVAEFDLTDKKTLPSRMVGLEIANNRFVRKFRASLSTMLRKVVEVDIISNNHLSFSELSKSIPIPSWINLIQIEPLPGAPFLAFDTNLSMAIIDYLCGGKGKAMRETKKEEFGSIEQHLMAKMTREAIECLEDVWKTIIPVKIFPGDVEFDSRYITSVSQDEMFVVTYFSTKIEESSGVLTLALPYTSLEPIKQKLTSTVSHDEQKINYSWLNQLNEYIQQTEANIAVEIGRKRLTIRDLLKINVGDIIILDKFIGDELIAYVETIPKFKGYPGHYKGNNALNVTSKPFFSGEGEAEDDRKNIPWP